MIKIKLNTSLTTGKCSNCLWRLDNAFVKFKIIIFSRNKHYLSPTLISILLSTASLAVFALLFVAAYFIHKKMKQWYPSEKDKKNNVNKINKDNTPDEKVEANFEKKPNQAEEKPDKNPLSDLMKAFNSNGKNEDNQNNETIQNENNVNKDQTNTKDNTNTSNNVINELLTNKRKQEQSATEQTNDDKKEMLNLDSINNEKQNGKEEEKKEEEPAEEQKEEEPPAEEQNKPALDQNNAVTNDNKTMPTISKIPEPDSSAKENDNNPSQQTPSQMLNLNDDNQQNNLEKF